MATAPFDDLLTEAEAAKRLRIGERTLRQLRCDGKIRYIALTARKIAYRLEDCEEYLAARVRVNDPAAVAPRPKRRARPTGKIVPYSERPRP